MPGVEFGKDPFAKRKKEEVVEKWDAQPENKMNDFLDNYKPTTDILKSVPVPEKKHFEVEQKEQPKKKKKEKKKDKSHNREDLKDVIVEKTGTDWTRALIFLSAFGIVAVIMMTQMANEINPAFILLIWLFGMMAFLPLGLVVGWLFLDPYMRCKVMRRMRGRNYGVVHFVLRGGQKIVTRIKDFDDDCIVLGSKLWYMDKDGIHYLDKNNHKIFHCDINPDDIKTMPSNVPALFLDIETMQPISFDTQATKTDPQHAGAIILGYINNQIAKNKTFRQSTTILMIIVLGMLLVNLILSYQLYEWVDGLRHTISSLSNQVKNLGEIISSMNPP